jgi:hypothetical protein
MAKGINKEHGVVFWEKNLKNENALKLLCNGCTILLIS